MSWKYATPPNYGGPRCPVDGLTLSVRPSPRTRTDGKTPFYAVFSIGQMLIESLDWARVKSLGVAWGLDVSRGKIMLEPTAQDYGLELRQPGKFKPTWQVSVSDLPGDYDGGLYRHTPLTFEKMTHAKRGYFYVVADLPVGFYERVAATLTAV